MEKRRLGPSGPLVGPIGFGAFKIGRNQKTKYGTHYELPSDAETAALVDGLLDLGIDYIDTAPAYGTSEARLGALASARRGEFTLSTKVGEEFADGVSTYDFSRNAVEQSVVRSLGRLRDEALDLVFIHATGDDLAMLHDTDVVQTLTDLREAGMIRQIGLSAKSPAAATAALAWADAIMVEYHSEDRSFEPVMAAAAAKGVGVVVKKALAAGTLPAAEAIEFVLRNPHVTTIVVGTLSLDHLRDNLATAEKVRPDAH